VLSLPVRTLDVADDEELSRFARLCGGTRQRLVAAGLQFFESRSDSASTATNCHG